MELQGKGKLKVIGIIFIITSIIAIIVDIMGLAGGGFLMSVSENHAETLASAAFTGLMVAYLIWGIITLVAGILGVKNCANSEKAGTLFILGVILIICSLISSIWTIVSLGFSVQNVIGLLMGLVLPGIFAYGAKQNQA